MNDENGKFCPRCNQPPEQVGRGDGCLDPYCAMREPQFAEKQDEQMKMTAAAIAHRACCGIEHAPMEGKLHGYCVVCGVPWPCETASAFLFARKPK